LLQQCGADTELALVTGHRSHACIGCSIACVAIGSGSRRRARHRTHGDRCAAGVACALMQPGDAPFGGPTVAGWERRRHHTTMYDCCRADRQKSGGVPTCRGVRAGHRSVAPRVSRARTSDGDATALPTVGAAARASLPPWMYGSPTYGPRRWGTPACRAHGFWRVRRSCTNQQPPAGLGLSSTSTCPRPATVRRGAMHYCPLPFTWSPMDR
jgi:hypothetical protein